MNSQENEIDPFFYLSAYVQTFFVTHTSYHNFIILILIFKIANALDAFSDSILPLQNWRVKIDLQTVFAI